MRRILSSRCLAVVVAIGFALRASVAQHVAADPKRDDELARLRREVNELRQRLEVLERRLDDSSGSAQPTSSGLLPSPARPEDAMELPTLPPAATSAPSIFDSAHPLSPTDGDGAAMDFGFALQRSSAGFRVTYVYKGSQAAAAGLRPRDLVVRLNGQDVSSWTPDRMAAFLAGESELRTGIALRKSLPSNRLLAVEPEIALRREPRSRFISPFGTFEFVEGTFVSLTEVAAEQKVPDFSIHFPTSDLHARMRSLRGRWVLVVFEQHLADAESTLWNTLVAVSQVFPVPALTVVVICMDKDSSPLVDRIRAEKLPWGVYHDGHTWDNKVALRWGATLLPTVAVVSPSQTLFREHVAPDRLGGIASQLGRYIPPCFSAPCFSLIPKAL
ncbi:hypothetical protein DB346_20175 [Verrucomicrobia bacterium LW23]|nr:hypothetical protein DB346_20175 [Verrucomicrobia bacterium LW23]